jgi:methionyl-tRNA synthetase
MDSERTTSEIKQPNEIASSGTSTTLADGAPQSAPLPAKEVSASVTESSDDTVDIDLFAKVKLRVATVEGVEPVPKSKKLYKIHLDVGSLGKRQIVSGIAQHYSPEQLVGKQIVIIANLKPAKLMGVESQGMLLAASTEGDSTLALLTPDKPITAGSSVR